MRKERGENDRGKGKEPVVKLDFNSRGNAICALIQNGTEKKLVKKRHFRLLFDHFWIKVKEQTIGVGGKTTGQKPFSASVQETRRCSRRKKKLASKRATGL